MNNKVLNYLTVMIIVCLPACQPSDDDDDNDAPEEDLHGNGWPEEGLPACPPYQEYEPWFTITNFENAADAFNDAYGEQFASAVIEMDNTEIYLTFKSIESIAISWLSDEVAAPFENEQNVQVAVLQTWLGYDKSPRMLWILDNQGQLLLYHDQHLCDYSTTVDSYSIQLDYDFQCEYYDHRPPTPDDNEWSLVFGRWISGSIDNVTFYLDTPGEYVLSEDNQYSYYLIKNYIGQFDYSTENNYNQMGFLLQGIKNIDD